MYIQKGLLIQLKCLKYSGLLPVYFFEGELKLLSKNSERFACLIAMNASCFLLLCGSLFCLLDPFWETAGHLNETGIAYELLATWIAGFGQAIANLCLYFGKERNLTITNIILKLNHKYNEGKNYNDIPLRLFCMFLVICVGCTLNMVYMYWAASSWDLMYFFQTLVFFLQIVFGGLISTFYASLVLVLNKTMISINEKIIQSVSIENSDFKSGDFDLKQIISDRSDLINLCELDISSFYGVPMLCILTSVLSNGPTGPYFALSLLESTDKTNISFTIIFMLIGCIIWMVQFLYIPVMVFHVDVDKEANKTAKILSRMSRRGSSIDKMVDKFLMKNMRQKPILTAYWFFPLNSKTLFNIFAAICTYLVILIQFKDLENTN